MAKTESISDERLAEMLAGLDGLPPSPYWTGDNEAELIDGNGRWLNTSHGEPIWEHFARCDPDTMRTILNELAAFRAANSDGGVELKPEAWMHPHGAIWRADNHPAGMDFTKDGWVPLYEHPPAKALDGIAVTALEWVKPAGAPGSLLRAETVVGAYQVWTHAEAGTWFWSLVDGAASGSGSQQKCFDDAQADFDRRVLSALK